MLNEQSHREVVTPPHGCTLMWLRGSEVYSIINGQWTHLSSVAPIAGGTKTQEEFFAELVNLIG